MAQILLLLFAATPVDFETDVLPVLTRAGCNAGACHGAAAGRGGFHLSLFGGDPESDHQEIVLAQQGRRVNFVRPERSLLLRKPTGDLDHEGGLKLAAEDDDYELVVQWIKQGARQLRERRLIGLRVTLQDGFVAETPATIPLQAVARYSDGSTRDVSSKVVIVSSDVSSLVATKENAIRILRGGRHTASVRYVSQIASVQVTAPIGVDAFEPSSLLAANDIDEDVNRVLSKLRLPPASVATDAELVRRVSLDLTGTLPTPTRSQAFLADKSPDKYEHLVDELIAGDDFSEYWTHRFEEWLRLRPPGGDRQAAKAFHQWLKQRVTAEVGLDRIAIELLTATGDSREVGPATFHRLTTGAREAAEHASETLMGVQLACANCHNHPLDVWTQDDYHGLAAIFARVDRGRVVGRLPRGEVSHPRTGERAVERIPGTRFLDRNQAALPALAKWLTAAENPYFARSLANRFWRAMMGRGLVEPVDDLRTTNPPTHPELLDRLAGKLRQSDYGFRSLLKEIAMSATYRRATSIAAEDAMARRFYASATAKPLPAAVLADAITTVTAEPFVIAGFAANTRAISVFDPTAPSAELDSLGRCARAESCESNQSAGGELSKSLDLLNGNVLNRRVSAKSGRLQQLLASGKSNKEIVSAFYWQAFCRPPTDNERQFWEQAIDADERTAALEDFLWSLLASRAFTHNH